MAYTNATFYIRPGGSDAARSALLTCVISNPSGSVISVNKTAHGLVAGAVFDATLFSAWFNAAWKVLSVTDADNFIVDGTWQATADNNGTITPRGGSSYADAWQTITNGATSARTQSGDALRYEKSSDPTSVGNGTWTDGPLRAAISIASSTNATPIVITLSGANYTLLAPAVGDTVQITSHATNTNANGTWKISAVNGSTTVTLVNADGTNSVGNGAGGATGTIRKINNRCVILASAVTKAIACTGNQGVKTNWTSDGGANVVCSVVSNVFKEGVECQQIAIGAGFTTGIAAHWATGTLDLSGYQQVSFWIRQSAGTVLAAGGITLRLCTDTAGLVSVHTIAVPALGANNPQQAFTVDLGTNLNSAIASIALYVATDVGAQTFQLDNIIACKASSSADSLSLTSLIGKNTSTESFWSIASINHDRVVLDMITDTLPTSTTLRGYSGTSETVTTYKRETLKVAPFTTWSTFARNGVTLSGGWDTSTMTSQTGETWVSGQDGSGTGFSFANGVNVGISKFGLVRFLNGLAQASSSAGTQLNDFHCNNVTSPNAGGANVFTGVTGVRCEYGTTGTVWFCANANGPVIGRNNTLLPLVGTVYCLSGGVAGGEFGCYQPAGTITASNNATSGMGGTLTMNGVFNNIIANNNGASGVQGLEAMTFINGSLTVNGNGTFGFTNASSQAFHFRSVTAQNNGTYGLDLSGRCDVSRIDSLTTSGNATAGLRVQADMTLMLRNWNGTDSTPLTVIGAVTPSGPKITSTQHGGVSTDNRVYYGGTKQVQSQTATRHAASGIAWTFAPTNETNAFEQYNPLREVIATFAVAANALVTVKCWIYRSSTSITAKLTCRGGQIAGVASDVSVTASGAATTWQEETITFTPTEAGVVEICAEVYGGTTNSAIYDDMTVSQA